MQQPSRPSRWVAALLGSAALLLVGMAWLTAQSILEDWRNHERDAHATVRNLSQVLEREIHAELDKVDLLLHTVALQAAAARLPAAPERLQALEELLALQRGHLPPGTLLGLADARGRVWLGTAAEAGWPQISQLDFFIRLRGQDDAGLVFGVPLQAPDQRWYLPLARRIPLADGRFAGVVAAWLPVGHYLHKFAQLQLGPNAVVALRTAEHRTVARHPEQREGAGVPGQFAITPQLRQLIEAQRLSASYVAPSPADGIERVFGYARLAEHPLYVVVGLSTRDHWATWRRNTAWTLGIALLFLLGTALLAWLALRAWHQRQQTERLWSLALQASGFGVFEVDLRSRRLRTALQDLDLLGYAEGEIGLDLDGWAALLHPKDRDLLQTRLQDHLGGAAPRLNVELRLRRKDGHWKWLHLRGRVTQRAADGRPLQLVGTYVDIDERRAREEELRLASTVFQMANEAMVITDADNRIVSVNPAFTAITGYEAAEVIGHNPRLLSARTHSRAFYEEMWRSLLDSGSWSGEVLNRRKNGEAYVEWLSIRRITDEDGQPTHHVAVFTDITERKASEQRIQHLALHDALTDLPNRALLLERLEQALRRAQRQNAPIGLIYFDLDRFKPVNDQYGHEVGDQLLKAVAQRVLGCLRAADTLARLGGDEFVILLPDTPGPAGALEVARKVLSALEQPFEVAGHTLQISGSLGVALYPQHGQDAATLLRCADAAMYQAKQQGRGRAALYEAEAA